MKTNKTIASLCFLALAALLVIAWNPASTSFNTDQFLAVSPNISIKSGVLLTNPSLAGTISGNVTGTGGIVLSNGPTLNAANMIGTTTVAAASINNAVFQSPVQETNAASGNYSWFGVDATNTIVFTNRYGQVVAAVSTNGIPIFPALAVGGVLTNAPNGVVSNTTVLPATMMSTTPTNDLNTTLRAYIPTVTNRPALYVDSSNSLTASLTFASSSNALALPCRYQLLVSATPTAITNITYPTAGYFYEGQLCISNSTAAAFTNYVGIVGVVPSGYAATNAAATLGKNAFVVPASKQVDVWFECRAGTDTNYSIRYR